MHAVVHSVIVANVDLDRHYFCSHQTHRFIRYIRTFAAEESSGVLIILEKTGLEVTILAN